MRDAIAPTPATPLSIQHPRGGTLARAIVVAGRLGRVAGLLLAAAMMIVPFLWMLTTSLKAPGTVLEIPPRIIPSHPTLESYREVFDLVPLGRMFANSLFVTATTVVLQLLTCALSGYAFARMRWRGRDMLFIVYLATLMVPSQVTITPLFILMRQLDWINTYQALILPGIVSAFGTFLIRQAMLGIPREYEEAAFLDGANHWQVFRSVVLPMVRPALATLAVFAAMGSWNDYLWPLFVINDQELMTLPVGLSLLQGRYDTDWNLLMAGSVISVVPIILVFLAAQRAFVNGVVTSGLK
ncbi:MAG TPA: carbohydrate ABC transporter permease [Thermomicrobiales bacterium]|jgi:multiple sugar transport system permease protein|nr:carbohydrate ABC transporter permease [Thermomicrobiales bacterium]